MKNDDNSHPVGHGTCTYNWNSETTQWVLASNECNPDFVPTPPGFNGPGTNVPGTCMAMTPPKSESGGDSGESGNNGDAEKERTESDSQEPVAAI